MPFNLPTPTSIDISVIVPAYNCSKYVLQCLKSIESQTGVEFEIIIINDASTDNTVDIIDEFVYTSELRYQITFLYNEKNLGVSKTIAKGFNIAKGKYICIVDSDDLLAPCALQTVVDYMNKNPLCTLSWTLYEAMDEDGSNLRLGKRSKAPAPKNKKDVIIQNLIHFVSFHLVTIRAESYFTSFTQWDQCKNSSAVDYEFILNNMFSQTMERIDRVCYYYRTRVPNSISTNRNVQSAMAKHARNRALAKAIDWNFITGNDVIEINEKAKNYHAPKRKKITT